MALTRETPDFSLEKDKKSKLVEQRGILPEFEHIPDAPVAPGKEIKPIKPITLIGNLKLPEADE